MGVIKFNINSKIFYEDNEYIIKSYPSVDKVLLKQISSPYKEIIVKELPQKIYKIEIKDDESYSINTLLFRIFLKSAYFV